MKISIGIITWENLHTTRILLKSIDNDISKIGNKYDFHVTVCDNGSSDGTVEFIEQNYKYINIIKFEKNMGEGVAKKRLVDEALSFDSKYMFIFDNDLEIIPNSIDVMINYMEENEKIGCFGQNIFCYSDNIDDPRICKLMPNSDDLEIELNVKNGLGTIRAWTHYSIFKMSIFRQNVNFDICGALGQPGYGFADDDLGMQITQLGYNIACFDKLFCFHEISSSVPRLKKKNVFNYSDREKYFKDKWSHVFDFENKVKK